MALLNKAKGVGDAAAQRLIERFGDDVHQAILDADPALFEVVSETQSNTLIALYREFEAEIALAQFLDRLGADARVACRVVRAWGSMDAEEVIENMYLLVPFLGWAETDRLAQCAGYAVGDPRRLMGAVEAGLHRRMRKGHLWSSVEDLMATVASVLKARADTAWDAIECALDDDLLVPVVDGLQGAGAALMDHELARWTCAHEPRPIINDFLFNDVIEELETEMGWTLSEQQRAAVALPLHHRVSCIAGYAGTGKTTVLKVVFSVFEDAGLTPHPMALAARAGRRIEEATGVPARTLEAVNRNPTVVDVDHPGGRRFNASDVLVIDEASMVDTPKLWSILRKTRPARLLLVGDPAQLPPIGPGKPFHELLDRVPTVVLDKIYRQQASSPIPAVAEAIRLRGDLKPSAVTKDMDQLLNLPRFQGSAEGVFFEPASRAETAETAWKVAWALFSDTLPGEMCILSPIKAAEPEEEAKLRSVHQEPSRSDGVRELNSYFSRGFNRGFEREVFPYSASYRDDDPILRKGDPVLWTENDYDLGLVNGMIGRYLGGMTMRFDGKNFDVDPNLHGASFAPGYAMTVHKAQGSAWRRVIFIAQDVWGLERSALYTAVTRATEQLVIIGDDAAILKAVMSTPAAFGRETALRHHIDAVR